LTNDDDKRLCNHNVSILNYNVTNFYGYRLEKGKLLVIFDFDRTLTVQLTYTDERWHRLLASKEVQSNIKDFEQTKNTLKNLSENQHLLAVCSYSDIHQIGTKKFNVPMPSSHFLTQVYQQVVCPYQQGYPLIATYLRELGISRPLIQAYKSFDENLPDTQQTMGKLDQIDHICQVTDATYEQIVYLDDDINNVNVALAAGIKAFWVTSSNYIYLLNILNEAATNPRYLDDFKQKYATKCFSDEQQFDDLLADPSAIINFREAIAPHLYYMPPNKKIACLKKIIEAETPALSAFDCLAENLCLCKKLSSNLTYDHDTQTLASNLDTLSSSLLKFHELLPSKIELIKKIIVLRKDLTLTSSYHQKSNITKKLKR
jgi:hypothetical protein